VPRDGLARHAQTGLHEAELAVAVRRLVEVHEVHVDGLPRDVAVPLGVQVQERLLQRVETLDPHLRRGEGVHPPDQPDARVVGVRLEHDPSDRVGRREHRLPDDGHGDPVVAVDHGRDLARLRRDLRERLVAVEGLAAGQEPDLARLLLGAHAVLSLKAHWP
jgi:hypothetical protein